MKDSEYWKNKLKQSKLLKSKNAEKIFLGYESPKIKMNHVILYRVVEHLDSHYWKEYQDEEGFHVGVLRSRVYDSREDFLSVFDSFYQEGWRIHREDINNPLACDPRAITILKREGYDLYA